MANPKIGVHKPTPDEPVVWRAWVVSPALFRGGEREVLERGLDFLIRESVFTVGFGGGDLSEMPDDWPSFRADYDSPGAFYFAKRIKPGDVVVLCRDTAEIAAWGIVAKRQSGPWYLEEAKMRGRWSDAKHVRDETRRVFAAASGKPAGFEAFDNFWNIEEWHEVDAAPMRPDGRIPGSTQPTLVPFSVPDACSWVPGLAAGLGLKRPGARSAGGEEDAERELLEGARYAVVLDRAERSQAARRRCIEHFGPVCAVCEMRFSEVYSGVQDRTIAVHHLRPIASSKGVRAVDPVKDLRPVCHNCHAVLHSRRPEPLSIEQAKARLRRARSRT